ncbi:MAG: hypothetical protein WCH34_02955 [Bacteroidota bacterium]
MEDKNENYVTMLNRIILLCVTYHLIVESVPKFDEKITLLKAIRDEINGLAQLLYATTEGITLDKSLKKDEASVKINRVRSVMFGYATETKNEILKNKMELSLSEIKKIRDADFYNYGKLVYDEAWAIKTLLVPYGISEAKITAINTAIDNFVLVEQQPRLTQIELEQKRELLDKKIKDCKPFLSKEIDKIAIVFEEDEPEFYGLWVKARRLPKTIRHKVSQDELEQPTGALDITVVNKITQETIEGALYVVDSVEFEDTTDQDGNGYIDMLLPKTYVITVTHPDYKTCVVSCTLAEGEYKEVKIELEALVEN